MGAVFRAQQKSLDRLVAIKVLPQGKGDDTFNFAERFKNEARTMARLNHPGIVHVHDFGETQTGLLYFIMEFVQGTDVQQLLRQQHQLPPSYALPIASHVCDALSYAHSHGVVHRDIKPANVMLAADGSVKVADFGLAKLDDPSFTSLTQSNMTMGTPDYIAPEALIPGGVTDSRADIYAVGIMLYHMLTGEVPRGMFELPSKRISGLDPRIDTVIAKAIQPRPEERYQTAAELRADIDSLLRQPFAPPAATALPPAATAPQKVEAPEVDVVPSEPMERMEIADRQSLAFRTKILAGIGAALVVIAGIMILASITRKAAPPTPSSSSASGAPVTTVVAPLQIDDSKWLPLNYPGDFGKLDGGVTQASDGSILIEGGFGRRLRARWTQADVALRANVRIPADGAAILGLRTEMNKPSLRVVIQKDAIEVIHEPAEDNTTTDQEVLRRFDHLGGDFDPVKGALITAAVLKDQCLVWLGEKYLGSVTSSNLPAHGKILFDGVNATFRDLQWQVIGDGSPPRVAEEPPQPGVWTPIRFPDNKPPKGEWRDDTLSIPIRESCPMPEHYAARDAALRAKVTVKSGDGSYKGLYFKLRNANAVGYFNLSNPRTAHVGIQPDFAKDLVPLADSVAGAFPLGKENLLVEFAAVGDTLILAIDGKVVAQARSDVPAVGKRADPPFCSLIQAGYNTAILRDLEFISLDGVSKDKYPDFIRSALAAPAPPRVAVSAPAKPAASPLPSSPAPTRASPTPPELKALMASYAAIIAEQVTAPHQASMKQLRSSYLAALQRAVRARQLTAADIKADQTALKDGQHPPPNLESTPDTLIGLRATYRAKATEYDDARTAKHLALLTPFIAKLHNLETELQSKNRTTDAALVTAYLEQLSQSPLSLPEPAKP